jgi:hypothetical protein
MKLAGNSNADNFTVKVADSPCSAHEVSYFLQHSAKQSIAI